MPNDQMTCPGCGEQLYLDPMNGWRNDTSGYTCKPPSTVHTDHIDLTASRKTDDTTE